MKRADAILEMHGIRTAGRAEDAVNRTLVQMHEDLKSNKQTLLLRGTIGMDRETILSKDLLDLGTLVAQVSRRNSIFGALAVRQGRPRPGQGAVGHIHLMRARCAAPDGQRMEAASLVHLDFFWNVLWER